MVRAALTLTLGYHDGLQSIAVHVGAPGQWLAWLASRRGCAAKRLGDGWRFGRMVNDAWRAIDPV